MFDQSLMISLSLNAIKEDSLVRYSETGGCFAFYLSSVSLVINNNCINLRINQGVCFYFCVQCFSSKIHADVCVREEMCAIP